MIKRIEIGRVLPMWIVACLLWSAIPARVASQGMELQVLPAGQELLTQEPRQIVTAGFMVRNGANRRIEIEPRLVLPEGWRRISQELPFDLAGNQSVVRMVSFMIPESARAGEYPVTYQVQDRLQPVRRSEYSLRVRILPAPKLQVESLETPSFAIAGAGYRTAFLVRNTGNASIAATFTVRSSHGSEVHPRAGGLRLEPGESQHITVDVVTPELNRRAEETVMLTVEVPGASIRESASNALQVVPRVTTGQAYRTLSTAFDMNMLGRDAGGGQTFARQFSFSGYGTLDDANTRHLSLALRGPDTRNQGSLGSTSEYWLNYSDRTKTALLGDNNYGLSWLTEPGRYGRGARLGYGGTEWGISAYGMEDRFGFDGEQHIGLNTYFKPGSRTRFDLNLLDERGGQLPGKVGSIHNQTQWRAGLSSELEFGRSEGGGEQGHAIRGAFYDNRHALRYYLIGWHAEPTYRSFLRDEEYLIAGFDLGRRGGWGLHGFYGLQGRNLDADPTRPAPRDQQANLGVQRTFATDTRFSLDYNARQAADSFPSQPVDIGNHTARLELGQSFDTLSMQYSMSIGETEERIGGTRFATSQHLFSASWRPGQSQQYGLYTFRDDNAYSNERRPVQSTFGVNASYTFRDTTSVFLDAQRGRSEIQRTDSITASLSHTLRNSHRIALAARHLDGRVTQTEVLLTYRIPFDLPVLRKPNMSKVRGRVFDFESGVGLPNVVLNLDGMTAVSRPNGEYEFPSVQAGQYQLSLDPSNIDVDKVPLVVLPLEVNVAAQAPEQIDIALVRSATADVRVRFRDPAETLVNALVTMSNGERIYRRLTDASGRVRISGLSPGRWTATLSADAIPPDYDVEFREYTVDVAPGGTATVEFLLHPKERDMTLLPRLRLGR